MKVTTRVGEIECPEVEDLPPRVKYWAEAVAELAKVEELYAVLGAALFEAYHAGQAVAAMNFLGAVRQEIIDVEGKLVDQPMEAGSEEPSTAGPSTEESDGPSDGSGSTESPAEVADVPGRMPEGSWSL